MAFSGNGAGRFQIRRLRNGSTAESLIFSLGPRFQDYSEPTGQHFPNWNSNEQDPDVTDWNASTNYSVGARVDFSGGIYTSITGGSNKQPTLGQTDDDWEYEGPSGTPLVLKPQLLVNGSEISLDGSRHAAPVNAAITDIQWKYLVGSDYEDVNTSLAGFSLTTGGGSGTNPYCLVIDRNLDNQAAFNNAVMDNVLYLSAVISYTITGILDDTNTSLKVHTSTAFLELRRNILTESSMFARILLTDTGVNGSAGNIWNSGFRGDKRFRVDMIVGASIANAASDDGWSYQWYNSDGTLGGQTARYLDITRADVETAETYHCIVTDEHTNMEYITNSIELRDFLDPIQFVEIGTQTVDTASQGELTVVPYQNGSPMEGLNSTNCIFRFEISQQTSSVDMTGSRISWETADGLTLPQRFPENSVGRAYDNDDDPVLNGGIARVGYDDGIADDKGGAKIIIADGELSNWGVFIDYDVEFLSVSNNP